MGRWRRRLEPEKCRADHRLYPRLFAAVRQGRIDSQLVAGASFGSGEGVGAVGVCAGCLARVRRGKAKRGGIQNLSIIDLEQEF